MAKKAVLIGSVLVLAIAGLLVVGPSVGHADPITITNVSVTVGDITYCGASTSTAGTCANTATSHPIWGIGTNFGATGITLLGGQSLILTQVGGFNFDSSEGHTTAGATSCFTGRLCATSITINGTTSPSTNTTLANFNLDDGAATHQEAANWSAATGVPNVQTFGQVFFGYADNAHSDTCSDTPDRNCFPNGGAASAVSSLFDGINGGSTRSTFFFGSGGAISTCVPGGHGGTTCFDSGAILIFNTQTPVPEPMTRFLGGTGLLALGYAARKRLFGRQLASQPS